MGGTILFDTSALFGLNRHDPKFDLLRVLKKSGSHTIGIPWMVREELVAQQVLRYREAHETASSAVEKLNRKTPWTTNQHIRPYDFSAAQQYWRSQYEEIFSILDVSGDDARTALAREAYCIKPAKVNPKDKGGARDVAIWLSVIDYLKENSSENIFFVAPNSRDFGDGTNYPSSMAEDLGDMRSRLTLLSSFEEVVERFTERIDVDTEHIKELLIEHFGGESPTPVETTAASVLKNEMITGTQINGSFESVASRGWILPPKVVTQSVSNASGHKIGNDEWYTATVIWLLTGTVRPAFLNQIQGYSFVQIACHWETKILFSSNKDQPPSIVDFESPKPISRSELGEVRSLIARALTPSTAIDIPQSSMAAALIALVYEAWKSRKNSSDLDLGDATAG